MFRKFKFLIITVFLLVTVVAGILISFVNINYDNSKYLPKNSSAKTSLELLEAEFGSSGYLLIMVDKISTQDEINNLINMLAIDNVNEIDYRLKEDKLLLQIVLAENDYSEATQNTVGSVINLLDDTDYEYYMNGQSYLTYYYNQMIKNQLPKIIMIIIPIILLILVVMTSSYIEPLLFILVIGIAIVLNMGTNAFLPNVSYLTYAISPVLQLALCMDYSIILFSRYRHYKKQNYSKDQAIGKAWKTSFIPILASSLTTVAGFIAIMFMRYRIGLDVGIVLAKGVVLSLVTVMFLLPVLILFCDNLMEKTKHRNLLSFLRKKSKRNHMDERYNKFSYRGRYVIPILAFIIIITAFFVQLNNKFIYSDTAPTYNMKEIKSGRDKIKDNFGLNNQVVILLDKDYDDTDFFKKLENLEYNNVNYLTSVHAYNRQYSQNEMQQLLQNYAIDASQIELLFTFVNLNQPEKNTASFRDIVSFIDVLTQFDIAYNCNEMSVLLNEFATVTTEELILAYRLMDVDEASVFQIIAFFNTPRSYNENMIILEDLITSDELQKVYFELDETHLTLVRIIGYFNGLFETDFDIDTMDAVLGDLITKNELARIYTLAQAEIMNIKNIIAFYTAEYDIEAIKYLLADIDEAKIEYVYQTLKTEGKLNTNEKISIGDFIALILADFADDLTEDEFMALSAAAYKMNMLDDYDNKIAVIAKTYLFADLISGIDLSQFAAIDTIDKENIVSQFIGNNYQRIILTVDLDDESEHSFGYFNNLITLLEDGGEEFYIVSSTTTIMAIKDTSNRDYLITTVISIGLIFLIIALSFKSLLIPLILIFVIEGAIFINMAIPSLFGNEIVFMGYLIVVCIQLGATIDYGILYTDRYFSYRQEHNRLYSIKYAIKDALPTVMTSGLILFGAGIVLSLVSSIPVVAMLGRLIGIGGMISVLSILILLPQIFLLFDGKLVKKIIR